MSRSARQSCAGLADRAVDALEYRYSIRMVLKGTSRRQHRGAKDLAVYMSGNEGVWGL